MKIKHITSSLWKVSLAYIEKFESTFLNISKLTKLLSPDDENILFSITALDVKDEMFLSFLKYNCLEIKMPEKNDITSEILFIAKNQKMLSIFEAMCRSDFRVVTFCGIKSNLTDNKGFTLNEVLNTSANYLIKQGWSNCVIDVVVDESLAILTFSSKIIDPKTIISKLKEMFL